MNPEPFTLRELFIMARRRGRFEWEQTSSLLALAVNLTRDPKRSKAVEPDELNPYAERRRTTVPLSFLKDVFVK